VAGGLGKVAGGVGKGAGGVGKVAGGVGHVAFQPPAGPGIPTTCLKRPLPSKTNPQLMGAVYNKHGLAAAVWGEIEQVAWARWQVAWARWQVAKARWQVA
jgi:hypothetical protein